MAEQIQINALIRPELDTGGIVKKVSNIQSLLSKIKMSPALQQEFNGLFNDFNASIEKINGQFSKGFETKGAVKSLETMTTEMRAQVEQITAKWQEVSSSGDLIKLPPGQETQLKQINTQITQLKTKLDSINSASLQQVTQAVSELKGKAGQRTGKEVMELIDQGQAQQAINLLDIIIDKRQKMNLTAADSKAGETFRSDTTALVQMRDALLGAGTESKSLVTQLEQLDADGAKIIADALKQVETESRDAGLGAKEMGDAFKQTETNIRGAATGAREMSGEMDQIRSRIQYFFSLANAVQLVRRALRQTFEAAKELDAAMTETAVVTDFSVGDMWAMLPKYTKTAQELGATTQGVYETLTLFYQQGLDTNEAMALGTETLKMARIAGMDYEEATSKMTAALRGFNMELNELSAQKVNDVYSELAAITAADTDQIATAMTKTASIANSANMEFETTAAFLSQIIETTQESAETAGTAMKTVIARFTELKKDPSLIGEVDGEVIDANKIETALSSIGVALRDNVTGQFRDLDDVFLDIAQKWEGLDTNTQRYIATIAAGSRQQSRFIAMMSDYERTMQLVNAANDSAGSSQKQFDKTLESMEAKLNQLKNTWQEFTLGLMDDSLLKGSIEALNRLLAVINKLTDLPGVLGSASKAFLSFFTLFAGKKLFNVASKSLLPGLVGTFTGSGKKAGVSFSGAFMQEFKKTSLKMKTLKLGFNNTEAIKASKGVTAYTEATRRAQVAQNGYTAALTKYGVTMESVQAGEIENAFLIRANSVATKTSVAADEAKVAAINQLRLAYGLETDQAKEALIIASAGVSTDYAAVASKKGLTLAELEAEAVKRLEAGATKEQIAAEMKKIIFEKASLGQKYQLIAIEFKNIAATKLSALADKLKTTSLLGQAAAYVSAKIAAMGATAATIAFTAVVAAAVAVIALIVMGIVALVKASKKLTLAERMEQLEQATERAKERAKEAKEAYDTLIETEEKHKGLLKTLNSLSNKTLEWKDTLLEANGVILDLIKTFPELAKYVSRDANGVLTFDDGGWEEAREKQLKAGEREDIVSALLDVKTMTPKYGDSSFLTDYRNEQVSELRQGDFWDQIVSVSEDMAQPLYDFGDWLNEKISPFDSMIGQMADDAAEAVGDLVRIPGIIMEESDTNKLASEYDLEELWFDFASAANKGIDVFSEDFMSKYTDDFDKKFLDEIATAVTSNVNAREDTELSKDVTKQSIPFMSSDFSGLLNSDKLSNAVADFLFKSTSLTQYKRESELSNKSYDDLVSALAALTNQAASDIKEKYSDDDSGKQALIADIIWTEIGGKMQSQLELFSDSFSGLSAEQQVKASIVIEKNGYTGIINDDGSINTEALTTAIETYEAKFGEIETETLAKIAQARSEIATQTGVMGSTSQGLLDLGENGTLESSEQLLGTLSQVEGIYSNLGKASEEWAIVSQQGIIEQMDYLAKLSQMQYQQREDNIALVREEREELIKRQESLYAELNQEGPNMPKAGMVKQIQEELEEIEATLKNTDWVLDIKVTDNFEEVQNQIDGIVSSFDKISEAASVLSENFEVSADDGKKLAEVFPGILKNATVTADGQIQLDEDVRNSAIEKAETMINTNAEAEKNIIRQEMAKLDAFIGAKTIELGVIEQVLQSENEAHAAKILADLVNEEGFAKEIEQIEQDSLKNNLSALEAKSDNEFEYGTYSVEVNESAATAIDRVYQEDVKNNKDAVTSKGNAQSGFLNGIKNAWNALKSGDWGGAWSAFWSGYRGGGSYTAEKVNVEDITATIDEDKLKESFNPVYSADGKLDSKATLKNYYSSQAKELEKAKSQLAVYEDAIVLIDAQAKQGINDLKNPGKSGRSSGKDEEPWKYEREYDENIKSKLQAAENEKQRLESELEGLINDENATTEDIIKKKLEIADAAKKQLALLQEQNKLDIEEAKRLQNEHLEWSNLYSIGDNGEITWDEQAINALGLSPEQGKIFEEWSKALTTAVENAAASTNDIVDKANEISEIIGTIYNEYDYLYNLELRLTQLASEREKLEQEYNNLIEDGIKTIGPLVSNLKKQYANLDEAKAAAQDKVTLANLKINAFLGREENKDYQKYLVKDENTGRYSVNVQEMEKLAASGVSEAYDPVAQFIEDFMALQDDSIKAEEELLDLEQERADLIRESEEAAAELESTYYDAIIEYMDRQIEEVEELYSSIDESNSRLLESIRESLELQRQEHQNAETETEINDMRNRLAYLQMDTSGANQNEILNLQKQIGEKEQDYTDTLIDQKIDELERQNDIAAEQRERQISILNYTHKQAQENGTYLKEAKDAIKNEVKGLPGTVGAIETGNEAFDKMFPKDSTMSSILQENLLSEGKMPTTTELADQEQRNLELIAWTIAGVEEKQKNLKAGDTRAISRLAVGLDDVNALSAHDFIVYDLNGDGKIDAKDLRASSRIMVGLHSGIEGKKFATGGIADYTGPAWLDGTKSRPELVLNQKDTQNFLQLKDVLSSFMSNNNSLQNSAENRGDNYYEIHLNVEKITSDYDVEQLANKVKLIIAEDANQRGVNSIYRRR